MPGNKFLGIHLKSGSEEIRNSTTKEAKPNYMKINTCSAVIKPQKRIINKKKLITIQCKGFKRLNPFLTYFYTTSLESHKKVFMHSKLKVTNIYKANFAEKKKPKKGIYPIQNWH